VIANNSRVQAQHVRPTHGEHSEHPLSVFWIDAETVSHREQPPVESSLRGDVDSERCLVPVLSVGTFIRFGRAALGFKSL